MHERVAHAAFIGIGIGLALFGLCQSGRTAAAPLAPPAGAAAPGPSGATSIAPPAGAAPRPSVTAPMTAAQVIQVLDQTVDWYRSLGAQQQTANEPSDAMFLSDNRQIAGNVMTMAVDVARADAEMLSKEQPVEQAGGDAGVSAQALLDYRRKIATQSASVQAELSEQRRELSTATRRTRAGIEAKINDLEGVRDLLATKQGILNSMTEFLTGTGGAGSGSLKAQIDAMALGVAPAGNPAAGSAAPGAAANPPFLGPGGARSSAIGRLGLWDMAADAFRLSEKAGSLESIDRRTAALQATLAQIRSPLIDQIKALSEQGDALAAGADSAGGAGSSGVRGQLEALAGDIKQASALLLPLTRETFLLGQYRRNLGNWRTAIDGQYHAALVALGIRLAVLLAILAAIFAAASLWQRMTLRYVQDTRRRYQLLLLRRVALWSLVVIVIGISFASELGSLVTFAGLITAGVAVAMQSVLVSIVGYFFLIGKYGIRVGDRVQIGDVAGEVIDLGLVRMYLMELGGKGSLGPTGRVVAFPNSVAFQVSSGLFKQIPGVNFTWREVVLSLPAGIDYPAAKERLTAAVTDALQDYRAEILRQTREIERTTSSSSAVGAEPQVQLNFSAAGVEAHVRYPVHLKDAADIDERVTEALARAVSEMSAPRAAVPAAAGRTGSA